jgi:hypothetical protein
MAPRCRSGKKLFETALLAEDVLIDLWSKNDYPENRGPISFYKCDDCGYYHLTSQGPMSEKLAQYLSSDKARLNREAGKWLDKFKKR